MSLSARLARLSRTPPEELLVRARMAGQQLADRCRVRVGVPTWRRTDLVGAVSAALPSPATRAVADGAWSDAHAALLAHVRSRPTPFLLTPAHRLRTAAQIVSAHPDARADAVAHAARIAAGAYDLLGYTGLQFREDAGALDWHLDPVSGRRAPLTFWADVPYLDPQVGDHKVIWELNRHQHWLALGRAWWLDGDEAFRTAFIGELQGWLCANPPLLGINWASSLEIAFRALSWVWALHFFADEPSPDEPAWSVDLLLGLDRQLRHLERNLSWYFSPNTHLLGEGLGLYVCGSALPELRAAGRWRALGRRVLLSEAGRQVLADGAHVERSPHYHRYALDFYLLALAVARLSDDAPMADAVAPIVDRMATWMHRVADGRGRLPLIGDDDGGELFPIAGPCHGDARVSLGWAADLLDRPDLRVDPIPEAVTWLTLHPRTRRTRTTVASEARDSQATLPSATEGSGYVLLRRGGAHVVMDGGPHGFLNGGHAHADALSVTLGAAGEPLLIDPGTATYTMDTALRNRFRSSQMHNTLVLDGRSQSLPSGPFHWASTAKGTVDRTVLTREFDYVRGETDAWAPVVHQRHLLAVSDDAWVVADEVLGSGAHELAVHWHLAPEWDARQQEGSTIRLEHPRGVRASLAVLDARLELFRGDSEPGLGWVAPAYGRLVPTFTVRATTSSPLPCWIVTAIGLDRASTGAEVSRLDVQAAESSGASIGILHRHGPDADITLVRGAGTHAVATLPLPLGTANTLTTDARVLHLRLDASGRVVRLCALDITLVRLEGSEPFRLTAPQPLPDLSLRTAHGGLTVLESSVGTDGVTFDADSRRHSAPALAARPAGLPRPRPAAASS